MPRRRGVGVGVGVGGAEMEARCCGSEKLARDVFSLVTAVGGSASVSVLDDACGGLLWWVKASGMDGQDSEVSPSVRVELRIESVELGRAEVYDIEVEESHDYLIDGLVSHNTVNVAADYPYEDFKELYMRAWKSGLKGIATYRPNVTLGAVLSTLLAVPSAPSSVPALAEDFVDDSNRRIVITAVPEPVMGSLRWPDRPRFASGNTAWTCMVEHPRGDWNFALFVGEAEESEIHGNGRIGRKGMFEAWVQGRKAPRGLGAIAKTLSLDMRAGDEAWLAKKLEALMKVGGEEPFLLAMPPDGAGQWASSSCQAMAKLLSWRGAILGGDAQDPGPELGRGSPLVDSLFSAKEPKTGAGGTMGWMADVFNAATGDDFVLALKEITLPDGTHRPYSVWMSGAYPKAFDGLCKLISLDMRVMDPAWAGMKLRKLLTYSEPLGEFMAKIPGNAEGQMKTWPSTVAYVAALVLHRFHQLGVLDHEGRPASAMGMMADRSDDAPAAPLVGAHDDVFGGLAPMAGKVCVECHVPAVIKKDGCEFCTACGRVGACG